MPSIGLTNGRVGWVVSISGLTKIFLQLLRAALPAATR